MKEQYIERYQRFFEMATIDRIEDMTISVYIDHLPKHFHVIKKDQFEVRLDINTVNHPYLKERA